MKQVRGSKIPDPEVRQQSIASRGQECMHDSGDSERLLSAVFLEGPVTACKAELRKVTGCQSAMVHALLDRGTSYTSWTDLRKEQIPN